MTHRKAAVFFLLLLFLIGLSVSLWKFTVFNPIAAASGILGVCVLDRDYVQIQRYPHQVILAKPHWDIFSQWLEENGYQELADQQMGSIHIIQTPNGELQQVQIQMNGYFAKWTWH